MDGLPARRAFGGALLATIFSSAGPVYYGAIGLSPDPFRPLLDYLHVTDETVPILALNAHKLLWDGYTGQIEQFVGISAFPSMHNVMATHFALLAWRMHRIAGIAVQHRQGFARLQAAARAALPDNSRVRELWVRRGVDTC